LVGPVMTMAENNVKLTAVVVIKKPLVRLPYSCETHMYSGGCYSQTTLLV